jgi:hypothetical protein
MKTYTGRYTQAELAKKIFDIEDELTQLWLDGGMAGITDTNVQKNFSKRIEEASYGRNTVRFDASGQPAVLVKFVPDDKAKLSYLYGDSTPGIHPAFLVDGVATTWYKGKYQPGRVGSTNYPVVLRGLTPWMYTTFDTTQAQIVGKGAGYCMATQQMEAYLYLLSMRNGFEAGGNTYYGRYYYAQDEHGVASGMYSGDNFYHTKGGSGPLSWSHDGTPFGVFDNVGNTWHWTGALRTVDGEIQTFANNNGAGTLRTVAAHAVASTDWKAIAIDGVLVTPEALVAAWATATSYTAGAVVMSGGVRYVCIADHSSTAGDEPGVGATWDTYWTRKGTLHYAWDGTKVIMTDRKLGMDGTSRSIAFGSLTANITVPAIAYSIGIFPKYTGVKGQLYINSGERVALRGGSFNGAYHAGVGSLLLYYVRGSSNDGIGGGLAYLGD